MFRAWRRRRPFSARHLCVEILAAGCTLPILDGLDADLGFRCLRERPRCRRDVTRPYRFKHDLDGPSLLAAVRR